MIYSERELRLGCKGPDVAELQIRLAGLMGTEPDGTFGAMAAINDFGTQYPFEFAKLYCACGECNGSMFCTISQELDSRMPISI